MTLQTAEIAQTTVNNRVNVGATEIKAITQGGAFERLTIAFGRFEIGITVCLN